MDSSNPYIGQIVDFYPDNHTRWAALVIQVSPPASHSLRPSLNLQCYKPNGEIEVWTDVPPVSPEVDEVFPDLTEKWAFAHEFNLQQEESTIHYAGTETNEHVGTLFNSAS